MKAHSHTARPQATEESDESVVSKKQPNKGDDHPAEAVEKRDSAKRNVPSTPVDRAQTRNPTPSGLEHIRERAVRDKNCTFDNLYSHLTLDLLVASFHKLKHKAAAGIDRVTWDAYRETLPGSIVDLHDRLHRGSYRAKPSRRSYLLKEDGSKRPLGVTSLEDKIVQQAASTVLNAIYEADFLGLSYGFREKRKPHDALDALAWAINRTKVNWILDADIKAFFDNLDHTWLLRFIRHRVADRRMLRLLTKWLKSGWVEKDQHYPQEKGVPQGAVISPLLANIYLHYVLDLWTHQWRSRTAKGRVVIVRYADDFVAGFELATEAQMYLTALTERLAKFGLTVHPDKTRLIEFGRFAECNRRKDGVGKPETFDFLGFTHICSTTRNGKFFLRRLTSRKRMKRKLDEVKEKIRARMHRPVNETGNWLRSVLIGHQNYFGVPGNQNRINEYYIQAVRYWHWCLGRRSQKGGGTWAKFERTRARLLPRLKVVHPFPEDRCDVRLKARAG